MRMDNPRMPPPIEPRPRESMDFREQGPGNRRPLNDRDYPRIPSREVDISSNLDPATLSKLPEDSSISAREGPHKDVNDLARDPLSKGARGVLDPRSEERPSSYGYDRERPSPSERYRDSGDYGRDPYAAYEGRGRDFNPREVRDEASYNRPRDSRALYQDYPAIPTENRPRDAYPARGPTDLDYPRTAGYDERYPRGPPMDHDPPRGRDGGYRDSSARSYDYGQKRRYDGGYVDQYGDDPGV